ASPSAPVASVMRGLPSAFTAELAPPPARRSSRRAEDEGHDDESAFDRDPARRAHAPSRLDRPCLPEEEGFVAASDQAISAEFSSNGGLHTYQWSLVRVD